MNAIEIMNLSKSYEGYKLSDINMDIPSGSIVGLIGENGAGKSTIIKLIMNSISRDEGDIKVLNVDNRDNEFNQVKNNIGVVLDESYFPEVLTPKNVNKIMSSTYKKWDEKAYFNYLEKFNLPLNKKFKDFSRGMKMKLAIAVALSHNSKLLILDEATSGLDPMIRDEVLNEFNEFTRDEENTILLSSHIVSDLEKICDYIAFIHNGELIFFKEKDEIINDYVIVKMSNEDFMDIPNEAIINKRISDYGVEALVYKRMISEAFKTEHVTLEDIILFIAKEVV